MNKKAPRSWAIRKGTMQQQEIERLAKELNPNILHKHVNNIYGQWVDIIQEVEAPTPVKEKGDYKAFALSIKDKLEDQEIVELTWDFIKSLFPQARRAGDVVKNLQRYHGLSYRRVENGRNDTYVFFIEPTREQLIVQLTDAETKVIELEEHTKNQKEVIEDLMKSNTRLWDYKSDLQINNFELIEENTQLKSDLSESKITNYALFAFAIIWVISIILKSVAL